MFQIGCVCVCVMFFKWRFLQKIALIENGCFDYPTTKVIWFCIWVSICGVYFVHIKDLPGIFGHSSEAWLQTQALSHCSALNGPSSESWLGLPGEGGVIWAVGEILGAFLDVLQLGDELVFSSQICLDSNFYRGAWVVGLASGLGPDLRVERCSPCWAPCSVTSLMGF